MIIHMFIYIVRVFGVVKYHKCEWARVGLEQSSGPSRVAVHLVSIHYLNVAEFKLLYVTCGANPKDGWRSFVRFQRADPNPTGIEEGGGGRPLRHQLK